MKRITKLCLLTALMLVTLTQATAQANQRRQQRKHAKTEARLAEAKRKGEIDATEKAEIDKKENKYHRAKNRATRNGSISDGESKKLKRKNRRLNREVKHAKS